MTNRISYTPQDFQKMCKQAERDHEAKKLVFLMERVKRQIAERAKVEISKLPPSAVNSEIRLPSRSVPLER
ncbi:MAG TPA: hypothetical protein VMU05_08635 [Dongiaceae bacterium]|nr:hypothetical protein [Dongiaceae bacterium]